MIVKPECLVHELMCYLFKPGKGGKNRRRGKNENESEKRELVFKEDGQGKCEVLHPTLPTSSTIRQCACSSSGEKSGYKFNI